MTEELVLKALDAYPTPFYLFDEAAFARTVDRIRASLPNDVDLCYAMKANPFIVRWGDSYVERVEVCSTGEMRICQREGIPMDKVVVSGVHKDPLLIQELMASDAKPCRFTVESLLQYELLEEAARAAGICVPILIRLTSGNQFGLDVDDVRDLMRRASKSDALALEGIHYFPGTQRTSARRLMRELKRMDRFLMDAEHDLGVKIHELEYGAGLPVEYFESDAEAAQRVADEQLAVLGEALGNMRFAGKVVVELGRALAAPCGVYATRVVDTKRNCGYNYAIMDGGMHQLVYYGHAMSLQQPSCRLLSGRANLSDETWNLYGSLCTTNDVLAKQMPFGDVHVGDVVLFERTGAYCMTEGISLFLSRDLPRIIVVDKRDNLNLVRDRMETYSLNMSTW